MTTLLNLVVAVEDEPFPRGPSGESSRLKLTDWLELAKQLEQTVQIEVIALGELGNLKPDIIEAFAIREKLLTSATFPTRKEHEMLSHFSNYWSRVEKSEVPAIGVIKGAPRKFPVFVRGEQGTFAGGGMIRTAGALNRLIRSGRPVVVRPWVDILRAGRRSDVRLELRVHVVASCAVAVEYLFPPWAGQRPADQELQSGRAWAESNRAEAAQYAERIAAQINSRWFVADFAGTAEGLRLVELNSGWCSGIADTNTARAVHCAILEKIFQVPMSDPRP